MTICFVHIPKTGGRTVDVALGKVPGYRRLGHGSRSAGWQHASQILDELEQPFSFTVVRNPWERLLSAWTFLRMPGRNEGDQRDAERFVWPYESFREFVHEGIGGGSCWAQAIHLRPQYWWVCRPDGTVCVDRVGRTAQLRRFLREICQERGLPPVTVGHKNRSRHAGAGWRDSYDAEMRQVVLEAYALDFELFGPWC